MKKVMFILSILTLLFTGCGGSGGDGSKDTSYQNSQKMLGSWQISYNDGVDNVQENYVFTGIFDAVDDEKFDHLVMGSLQSIVVGSTTYSNISNALAVATYLKSEKTMMLVCLWDGESTGTIHQYNFSDDTIITGSSLLIVDDVIENSFSMTGRKLSSSAPLRKNIDHTDIKELINKLKNNNSFKENNIMNSNLKSNIKSLENYLY